MELRQLEYFREIASTGSINEAARHLNMSQPPLSYQIRQLENELNVKLFDRTSKGVTLTEAGKLLYDRSGNLLEYARSTELEVSKTGKKRILRIGLTPTTVDTIMPYISQFSKKNPDVNFEVHDGITYSLYQYLLDGIIDISVARTPLRLDEVSYMELCSEPMIAVSAAENTASSLKLADLLHRPLILYRRYEELIMNTFHAQNMNPDIFCVCDDPRGAMLWAKENLATAIFPQSMASLCDGLCIQELDEPDLVTKILLIWAKGKKPVPLVQEFLNVCGER
nr:LysR family transcriptional regulator [uncultured Dorea sp.]